MSSIGDLNFKWLIPCKAGVGVGRAGQAAAWSIFHSREWPITATHVTNDPGYAPMTTGKIQ